MINERKRFDERFSTLIADGGLQNVKFFVRRSDNMKISDFLADVNRMNDTIAAGDFEVIETLDSGLETKRFDAAF